MTLLNTSIGTKLLAGLFLISFLLYSQPSVSVTSVTAEGGYAIVDTGQIECFNNDMTMTCSSVGASFYGQDASYSGLQPAFVDNGDGTITDENTGLMWQKEVGEKLSFADAVASADSFELAGFDDWRLPSIKELYSLIDFSGEDVSGWDGSDTSDLTPFIDTDFFAFEYGDTSSGERIIDVQYVSSTQYVSTTMGGAATVFGVNLADGRIKGYPSGNTGVGLKSFAVKYVRGNTNYGVNSFVDNGDRTITDEATGLMWLQDDSGSFGVGNDGSGALNWEQALQWAENLDYAGYSNWRLPNAKELQSIVDYTRSPATTSSAAIDPMFNVTSITDEGGEVNYPFYWTGTTHQSTVKGDYAVYVAFGEALGWMETPTGTTLMDVHGAGAQRSDPKTGDPADFPTGHGPQGDVIRIYNYVRPVRGNSEQVIGIDITGDSSSSSEEIKQEVTRSVPGFAFFALTGVVAITAARKQKKT